MPLTGPLAEEASFNHLQLVTQMMTVTGGFGGQWAGGVCALVGGLIIARQTEMSSTRESPRGSISTGGSDVCVLLEDSFCACLAAWYVFYLEIE